MRKQSPWIEKWMPLIDEKIRDLDMMMQNFVFYIFGFLALASAIMVITVKHPVQAVLSLVLTFFMTSIIWLLLEAEFLALTLVLVYVGAVMVLFLFVVMMLDIDLAILKSGFARFLPLALGVGILVLITLVYALKALPVSTTALFDEHYGIANLGDIKRLGEVLFREYLLPFELAGVLLLVAMIAAISLTFRGRKESKTPIVSQQLQVNKKERLRVIKGLK